MNHRGCEMTDTTWCEITTYLNDSDLVVLTGVGKSMDVANRGASLLLSAGVPAVAIHATDLLHGPSTVFTTRRCSLVMLSNSGKTQEVIDAGSHVEEAAHFLLAITMDGYSDIAQMADRCMLYPIPQDSGPFGRLPTESSECQQRWIDAIANHFAVQNKHNLKFGHPGGQIGKHYDTTD